MGGEHDTDVSGDLRARGDGPDTDGPTDADGTATGEGETTAEGDASEASAHEVVEQVLDGRDLVVVSNRQPYSHEYDGDEVVASPPAGGLTAALDPLVGELGGGWVAWGSGAADREVVDAEDRVALPPGEGTYDLRRVWLDEDEVEGYYRGFSNRVLWPACHTELSTVDLRPGDWETYRAVNERFADAAVDRAPDDAVVWFQDYHLGLAPRRVREAMPDATLAQFWHVPWPPADVFAACPHGAEVLGGLLATDMLGFQTALDCRNFLDSAERAGVGRVDRASGTVSHGGTRTHVRSFPIGIDAAAWVERAQSDEADRFWRLFREAHDLGERVAVGVERLDYTKGIERRLDALETLWTDHPDLQGELTYVQKVSVSRGGIPAYRRLRERVERRVGELNDRFGTDDWEPVVYTTDHLSRAALAGLYREADLALVTPVRDGMNLVAKEFAAAQRADPGVLVLSELAGASGQLGAGSTLVNPYDPADTVEAVVEALALPADERARRTARLQRSVGDADVYDWVRDQFRALDRVTSRPEAGGVRR